MTPPTCCNQNCNQGRDCPLRTNNGADKMTTTPSAERELFEATFADRGSVARHPLRPNEYAYQNVNEYWSISQKARFAELEAQVATARDDALEEAAAACHSLAEKIGDPAIIGDGRAEGAHNTLTAAVSCIRALKSHPREAT